jgi:cobalt-zinc-cadmium efflux system membrane fusion protein
MTGMRYIWALVIVPAGLWFSACESKKVDAVAAAPPKTQVVEEPDLNVVKIDRPERFSLVVAGRHEELPEVHATGTISPNIEKSLPVISLASGRVVAIYAKLGDDVRKGQLLLKILSNDITNAFQTYRQAKADEELARKQLERSQLLFGRGAISLNDLQVAEDTYEKAKTTREASEQALRTLGADINNPDPVVNVYAPADGTIVEQNIVGSSIVHTPDNQPNLFTIANLSNVWVVCNVYENNLPNIRLGDTADVQLNAYPDQVFHGRISNIGKVLDATIRTAPVRIVVKNPGIMRSGMFVTATFYGQHGRSFVSVPSTAVLRLHDRDWVFVAQNDNTFRRTPVTAAKTYGNVQDIASGLAPGERVVSDALALSAESNQ